MGASVRGLVAAAVVGLMVFSPGPARAQDKGCVFSLRLPTLHVFPLFHHVKGDDDLSGKDAEIDLQAILHRPVVKRGGQAKGLRLDLNVKIADFKDTGTAFEGNQSFWINDRWLRGGTTADLRDCLDRVFEDCVKAFKEGAHSAAQLKRQCTNASRWNVTDFIKVDSGINNRKWTQYEKKGAGLLQSAECLSDANGNDAGKIGCRNITFRPDIRIDVNFGSKGLAR